MKKKVNYNSAIFSNILYCSYSIKLLSNFILINEFKNLLAVSKEINKTLIEFIRKVKYNGDNNELINFSKFKYLINLDLRFFKFNNEFINRNKEIKSLNLYNTNIKSLSSSFNFLETLNLSFSKFDNFKSINLLSLKKLYLRSTSIKDLNDIKNNLNLKILDIGETNISNLRPLKKINLKYLFADNTNINTLIAMSELKHLDIRSNNKIYNINNFLNIENISYMPKLKTIDLRGCNINDIYFLKKLSKYVTVFLKRMNEDNNISSNEFNCNILFSN
tara:strand:- start:2646 stop:3473 length:828 start_codon:yes stop_codon:yes gene_type:complete